MNQATRKLIEDLESKIEDIKGDLESYTTTVDEWSGDEQNKFDNLSEGLQASESGQETEAAANTLSEASSYLNDAVTALDDVIGKLSEARGDS